MRRLNSHQTLPFAAFALGFFIHVLFAARFGGRWLDIDTARISNLAADLWSTGELPPLWQIYGSGVGQPLLTGFVAEFMGVTPHDYNQFLHPIVGTVFLLGTWLVARRVSPDPNIHAFAIFLAATGPELIFETSRGSHGALAHTAFLLLLLCLFAIINSRGDHAAWGLLLLLAFVAMSVLNFKRAIIGATTYAGILLAFGAVRWKRLEIHTWRPSPWIAAPPVAAVVIAVLINAGSGGYVFQLLGEQLSGFFSGNAAAGVETAPSLPPGGREAVATSLAGTWSPRGVRPVVTSHSPCGTSSSAA